jgi:hypothetical protein
MLTSARSWPLSRALGLAACAFAACAFAACASEAPPASPPPPVTSAPPVTASAAPGAAPTASSAADSPAAGRPCGALDCRLFDKPEEAFLAVLATKPKVLGIGEAHAQKGMEGIDSAAKRFTQSLLPLLKGRASDLVVELMLPPKGCKPAEQKVRTHQREVTKHQAASNQNEYVTMGDAARKLGVIPDALRPTCADLDAAAKAGDLAIPRMLETIARLAGDKARELSARNEKLGQDRVVVLYGGALHNDASPAPEKASWSFGPGLDRATNGRYAELDVFVPESIQDTQAWQSMPWYPHYDKAAHAGVTVLFKTGPSSWAMIFPRTKKPQ